VSLELGDFGQELDRETVDPVRLLKAVIRSSLMADELSRSCC